jgi:hypothetical protein
MKRTQVHNWSTKSGSAKSDKHFKTVVHRFPSYAMTLEYAVRGDSAGLGTRFETDDSGAVESRIPFLVGHNTRPHDLDHRRLRPVPDYLYSSYDCRTQKLQSVLL